MRPGDTPVPITNTMVKTRTAEDTALETVWESRGPPDQKKNNEGKEKCERGLERDCVDGRKNLANMSKR